MCCVWAYQEKFKAESEMIWMSADPKDGSRWADQMGWLDWQKYKGVVLLL